MHKWEVKPKILTLFQDADVGIISCPDHQSLLVFRDLLNYRQSNHPTPPDIETVKRKVPEL